MAFTVNQTDSSYVPSSSSTPRWNVFLSFRGKDTRKNFTGHLYMALKQAGIRTFMDDPELPRGEEISPQLLKAIQESKISIVVFSKNYASSRWCLDELVKILECKRTMGQIILPVFYNVDPAVVRHQIGSFAEAFEKHILRFADDIDKVEKWKGALTDAANLSGYDLENEANGDEAKLIQIIVEKVLLEVNVVCLKVAKQPVGIVYRVAEIRNLLSIGANDIRRIGIYGMGGIGKTTIAKALFNEIFRYFEGCCFLANVREASGEHNGILHLQTQLLYEILKEKNILIGNVDKGISLLEERLCSKKVLIVLDDLDHINQFDWLIGQWNKFALGSRIIITTRDAGLLDQTEVDGRYNVRELHDYESLELFSRHAFKIRFPPPEYMSISLGIVRLAGGLPLALEILGSYLFKRPMIEWRRSFEKLQQIPRNEIEKKLSISYLALGDDTLKDIFLDIACFFIGKDKDMTIGILNSCFSDSENEIIILIERCLLSINENNELRMHDLVRDMGREIVRKQSLNMPGKCSRLWSEEDIRNVLERCKGTEAIEGIVPYGPYAKELGPLSTKTFENMERLRLLNIDGVNLSGSFENILEELRWLSWRGCPLPCLPCDFHLENLAVLDLQNSKLNILRQGILFLQHLKTLNVSHCECLMATPDFKEVPFIEKLLVVGCKSLVELHPSIGGLSRLLKLDLTDCENLRILPSSICNLRVLQILYLDGCTNLKELPEELGNMECLRELHAGNTKLIELPYSIGYLNKLEILSLPSLRRRALVLCSHVRGFLPPSISGLCSLKMLDLSNCYLVERDIPDYIGSLSSLEDLNLSGNYFCSLSDSLSQLSSLKMLKLRCPNLQSLPKLPPNLRTLYAVVEIHG